MESQAKISLREYLSSNKERTFSLVKSLLGKKSAGLPPELRRQLSDYSLRKGKYTRPALILLFAQSLKVSGPDLEKTRLLAAVYQILTDWGIAEDDILDSGKTRRGGQTLHVKYGLDFAVNAMDLLHSFFMDMLRDSFGKKPEVYFRVYDIFSGAASKTLLGQYLDIRARKMPPADFTEREYFRILGLKTGYMTGLTLLELGSFFAAKPPPAGTLKKLGRLIGTAYQLKDDILDMDYRNRDSALFSKPYGNDVYERKRTLLLSELLKRSGRKEREKLLRIYGAPKKPVTPAEADYVVRLMYEKGVIDYAKSRLKNLSGRITAILENEIMPVTDRKYSALLKELVSSFYSRNF